MDEIETFLNSKPETADLASQMRAFLRSREPQARETLHTGWKVISWRYKRTFCSIAPHTRWVNVQFSTGAALADPDGLLEGTGKAMRHVKVRSAQDLSEALGQLVHEAAERARR